MRPASGNPIAFSTPLFAQTDRLVFHSRYGEIPDYSFLEGLLSHHRIRPVCPASRRKSIHSYDALFLAINIRVRTEHSIKIQSFLNAIDCCIDSTTMQSLIQHCSFTVLPSTAIWIIFNDELRSRDRLEPPIGKNTIHLPATNQRRTQPWDAL